jgi:thymidylate synthase
MTNEEILIPYFKKLNFKLLTKNFIIDKTGVKIVELLNVSIFNLNPNQEILDFKFKKTNIDYCKKELNWYLSKDLSIINYVDDIKIWNNVCTKDNKKEINSNYGWCIFSENNYKQFKFAIDELLNNKESRRACIIYNRPSITIEYDRNGMSDYICTMYTNHFIRNNKLIYIIHQRSCDLIYGALNDFYWHCYVYHLIISNLREKYKNLEYGYIYYNIDSLHCYEHHFTLLKKIVDYYE